MIKKYPFSLFFLLFIYAISSGFSQESNLTVNNRGINSCASELIISEYIEGSSYNKYIEIYNGTGASIDIGDYEIRIYSNGSSSPSSTIALTYLTSLTLLDGNVFVIANSSASAWGGTPDQTSGSLSFNGDDVVELYNIATNMSVDIIGKIGQDPGSEWGNGLTSTANNTLVRKSTVVNGDTNGSDAFNPAVEWDGYAQDDVSNLGSHTMTCAPCTEPTTDAIFHANSPQSVTTNSLTLNWTNGDGANRIVVMSVSPITFIPTDGQTYTANTAYATSPAVATNTYVVYNGNANTVDITNLVPGTFYYTKIFEYNCNPGSEDYYTSGTPTTDSFYTKPEKPNTFTKVCGTETTISLEWSAPANGNYTGFLLVVRENATPHSVNSIDPSSITNANTNFILAGTYGATAPNSRFLYVGSATNATITGLAQGTNYTFAILAFSDNGIDFRYSVPKTLTRTIGLDNVINANATASDMQATINWTNPGNLCYDEVLVVINETNGISFSPSGDGSSYTPNTVYTTPDQVVYLGAGNNVIVTNLTNGTTYYAEIFVRNGTEWSTGVEVSFTPNSQTIFKPGDMVIVGYDNKVGSSDDVVTIATFVDIQPNTTFWYSNATYEVGAPANVRTKQWKSCTTTPDATIGSQKFTYLGPDVLPAGSTFCISIGTSQVLATDFTVHPAFGSGTYNFSDGFIPAGFFDNVNISTSKPDAIFLMQGSWSADLGGYRTFNGVVLGGIQDGASWYTISDDLSSLFENANRVSRVPPEIQCFAIQGTTSPGEGYAYYNGTRNDTHIALLSYISDFTNNWIQGIGTNANEIAGNSCDATYTFTISGTVTPGVWTNAKNDNNWFNCGNWENLAVPDAFTNVVVNTISGSDAAIIDANATDADIYNGTADCKDLVIAGEKVVVEGNANSILKIHGDLNITGGKLDMDDSNNTTADGTLYLFGNWINTFETNFLEGNSTVHLVGNSSQNISCNSGTETEKFYNLTLNNAAGVSFASNNIHAAGDLHIINAVSPITVTANHYVLAGKSLLNDNNTKFIIQDQGSFVQQKTGTDTNTGSDNTTFEVHKTTTPYVMYDYTYWSSPIKAADIATVFAVNNPNYMYWFKTQNFYDAFSGNGYPQTIAGADTHDDNGDDWQLATGTMINGRGYAVMGEGAVFPFTPPSATTYTQSVNFKGNVNNGLIQIDVYKDKYNTDNGSGDAFNKNDNLIGNPYPSAIDAATFLTANPNLGGTIYFWTHDSVIGSGSNIGPDAYNFTNDDYASWNSGLGGTAAHAGSPVPNGKIASGQGFVVTATVNETIHFDNDMRVLNSNNQFFRTNRIWLNLTNDNGLFRQILIGFDANATDGEDRDFDSLRPENGDNYDFYSLLNDKKMGIQGFAPFAVEKVVPLGIENISEDNLIISIDHFESDFNDVNIYLKDNLLGVIHDLKQTDYSFTENRLGNINDRFELVFSRNALNTNSNELLNGNNLIVSNTNSQVLVKVSGETTMKNIQVYDVIGKLISNVNVNTNEITLQGNYQTGAVYFVKVILQNGQTLNKKFIKM